MTFVSENFLLRTKTAQRLYHAYAHDVPICDFHNHLPSKDIAEDRRFRDLAEIWLEGDHYKWRAMRADGVAEKYCTGDAAPYEKFAAWARTVPHTLRNPLYHWTHLELVRYFGIHDLLDETMAADTWARANEILQTPQLTAQGILQKFRVEMLCTTDDPAETLEHHDAIAKSSFAIRVLPTFRPDGALHVSDAAAFNQWTDKLGAASNKHIASLADFEEALHKRHDDFHQRGCRLSDHGLNHCYAEECTEREAAAMFSKLRSGVALNSEEAAKFASYLLLFFGRLDAKQGWTKQLHLGARRNVNTRITQKLGRDSGFDLIGDWPQLAPLAAYLDRLDRENALPKMIVYNLNPADNYGFATMAGNFCDENVRSKVQFGSAWWFLDQKEGIEWQLNALSNCGLLANFVGMVTDSRSFMSFPRHEYFRRILCNLLGNEIEAGLLPKDEDLTGRMVRNICFDNAVRFLGLSAAAT